MKNVSLWLKELYGVLISPAQYYASVQDFQTSALRMVLGLLGLLVVLAITLFAAAFLNAASVSEASELLRDQAVDLGLTPIAEESSYAQTLLFPVNWSILIVIVSFLRHITTILFGEDQSRFSKALLVSGYGALPLIIAAYIASMVSFLSPFTLGEDGIGSVIFKLMLIGFVLFVGWLFEGYICINGFRTVYSQNMGRSVLTWLAPVFFCGFLFSAVLFIVRIF